MTLSTLLIAGVTQWIALALIMAGGWALQRVSGNSGYVDAVWTFGVGAVGAVSALVLLSEDGGLTARQAVVAVLIAAWSLRLGLHIVARSRGATDDPRYAALAEEWGEDAPRRMFIFLQFQALASLMLVLTVFVAAHNPAPFSRLQDWLGLLVIAAGLIGEGLSDRQLRDFAATRTKDKRVCDTGLWGWSRHPNYFFEWMFWLAFPFFAVSFDGTYLFGWLALLAPVIMYWLLVRVSGIPPLEKHMVAKYGEAYRAYQRRVSAFFPLPPREKGSAS